MLPSALPFTSNLAPPLNHKPHFFAVVPIKQLSKSQACFASSSDESRWLREEERWLREEQRWLREESRWNAERQSLLMEINTLKLRIQELERVNSVHGASVTNVVKLLQALKDGEFGKTVDRIADGTIVGALDVDGTKKDEEEVIKEVVSIPEDKQVIKKRMTLRVGSEGEDVLAMQEALQKLGFYSGEEDMEFSSFSSGTERAVKTWQSTVGAKEDGIMTAELLELLFGNPGSGMTKSQGFEAKEPDLGTNGATIAAITNTSEIQQTVVTKKDVTEVGMSEHRVYLLGENRWEEPSRLSGGKNPITKNKTANASTKCLTCRGEGRLLCMECDGSGEPNVEPQFLEWVGEDLKCPYCEGLGYNVCDACGGKTST